MSYFKVDLSELMAAVKQMELAVTVIEEMTGRNESLVNMASASGRPDVQSAMTSFIDSWSYGLSCMKEEVTNMQAMLRTAGQAYEKVEGKIVQAETV